MNAYVTDWENKWVIDDWMNSTERGRRDAIKKKGAEKDEDI